MTEGLEPTRESQTTQSMELRFRANLGEESGVELAFVYQDGLKELKALLRRAEARTREALVEAMGRAQEAEEETKASPELPPPRLRPRTRPGRRVRAS